eukprot:7382239-Prymnesium_polylepis.2
MRCHPACAVLSRPHCNSPVPLPPSHLTSHTPTQSSPPLQSPHGRTAASQRRWPAGLAVCEHAHTLHILHEERAIALQPTAQICHRHHLVRQVALRPLVDHRAHRAVEHKARGGCRPTNDLEAQSQQVQRSLTLHVGVRLGVADPRRHHIERTSGSVRRIRRRLIHRAELLLDERQHARVVLEAEAPTLERKPRRTGRPHTAAIGAASPASPRRLGTTAPPPPAASHCHLTRQRPCRCRCTAQIPRPTPSGPLDRTKTTRLSRRTHQCRLPAWADCSSPHGPAHRRRNGVAGPPTARSVTHATRPRRHGA